jgi:hypothetical protein
MGAFGLFFGDTKLASALESSIEDLATTVEGLFSRRSTAVERSSVEYFGETTACLQGGIWWINYNTICVNHQADLSWGCGQKLSGNVR